MERTKVVYIVASGRSGSTVLGNTLGELDGFWHAGELRTIWGKGLMHQRFCGCGVPVLECSTWAKILELTCDGDPLEYARHAYGLQRSAVRLRHVRRLLSLPDLESGSEELSEYARLASRLYASIGEITGARVVVDSSKRQADAALLGLLPDIDPYFVHLVRDPRAVAYSWQRRKPSPGEGKDQQMIRYGTVLSARKWVLNTLSAEAIRRRYGADRSVLVRYEDFVAEPAAAVQAVLDMVGERSEHLPFEGNTLRMSVNHTAGGNPNRLREGPVALRLDDEWLRSQASRDRFLTTMLALPILGRYGYAARPRPRPSRPR